MWPKCVASEEYAHLGVFIAFYEIYCGKLFDLLNNRQVLHARENAKGNVVISGLQAPCPPLRQTRKEQPVGNVQDLMEARAALGNWMLRSHGHLTSFITIFNTFTKDFQIKQGIQTQRVSSSSPMSCTLGGHRVRA